MGQGVEGAKARVRALTRSRSGPRLKGLHSGWGLQVAFVFGEGLLGLGLSEFRVVRLSG